MLNYVWLGLLMLGIGVALSTDLIDSNSNKYRNGKALEVELTFNDSLDLMESKTYDVLLSVSKEEFNDFYDQNIESKVEQNVKLTFDPLKDKFSLFLLIDENSPLIWKKMAEATHLN